MLQKSQQVATQIITPLVTSGVDRQPLMTLQRRYHLPNPNSSKSAELQIIIWFLEAGWELFTPVTDLNGTDIVVRSPGTEELLALQVKHKEPGALNEGRLVNDWATKKPAFDYLIFIVPQRMRGFILPTAKLRKSGKAFIFYKKDADGYPRGNPRPLFSDYAFDLSAVPPERRPESFASFFSKVHANSVNSNDSAS